jgi:hypothetical protein
VLKVGLKEVWVDPAILLGLRLVVLWESIFLQTIPPEILVNYLPSKNLRLVITNQCKKKGGEDEGSGIVLEGFYLTRSFCNQHCCHLPGKTDPQEKGVKKKCLAKFR